MKLHVTSDAAMHSFGVRLAHVLSGGVTIQLVGDVGAGKTTLTKGIAAGLGVTEAVQSPSFTISRVYDLPDGRTLAHYDFYRLSDPGILANELAETASDPQTITVIEWADIVAGVLPADTLTITIVSPTETERDVVLSGNEAIIRSLT